MWRRCRGLPGVPALVETPADFSQFISPSLQCSLAESRASAAGIASQALQNHRRTASTHLLHNHAVALQQACLKHIVPSSSWTSCAFHDHGYTAHFGQVRSCQSTSTSAELDPSGTESHTTEASLTSHAAVLRSAAAEDGFSSENPAGGVSTASSEAQPQPATSHDTFEISALEGGAKPRPVSALEAAQSLSSMQQNDFTSKRPQHGRPSRRIERASESVWTAREGEITSLAGLEQGASYSAGVEIASLEQGVEDPGSMTNDEWDDYISIVRARREAAASADPSFSGEGGVPQEVMDTRILRGGKAVTRMQSWKEMADWLREYRNHWFLKASEISRMWTHMVQLHMGPGVVGKFDHRKMIYPDAPFFSPGGREFLKSLTRVTRKRLQLTLRLIPIKTEEYWENCRVRAPDAGRMLWAMGKLQWQSEKLLRLLEAAAVLDIDCEWNRPRYMTTALWGSAWSAPGVPLLRLCNALQKRPQEFWDRGTNAQNVCNMAWAMSMMRFQPSQKFSHFFQTTLHHWIDTQPKLIHPQNIGDMVQALAVMRREPSQTLLYAADKWMHVNVHLLLPSHIVAYMNGLGLMRRLTPEQYQYYGESLEAVMTNASEQDVDVFAQRMYVLHHLVAPRATGELPSDASEGVDMWEHASGHASDYKLMYFRGEEDLPEPSEFLKNMEVRGAEIVRAMLLKSSKLIEKDESTTAVRALLASIGYHTSIAPFEAAQATTEHDGQAGPPTLSPLLPELFVRTRTVSILELLDSGITTEEPLRREEEDMLVSTEGLNTHDPSPGGPYVALQLIRENDCFCNAKSLSLDSVVGETALVRTILNERGTPTTEVFVEQLLSLPSVEEMQELLRNKLQPLLQPGTPAKAPALQDVRLHGPDMQEENEEEIPLVATPPAAQKPPIDQSAAAQTAQDTLDSDDPSPPPLDSEPSVSTSAEEASVVEPSSSERQVAAEDSVAHASSSDSFQFEAMHGTIANHPHYTDLQDEEFTYVPHVEPSTDVEPSRTAGGLLQAAQRMTHEPHASSTLLNRATTKDAESTTQSSTFQAEEVLNPIPDDLHFEKSTQNIDDGVSGESQNLGAINEPAQGTAASGMLHTAKTVNSSTVSSNVLLRQRAGMLADARTKIVRTVGDSDITRAEARDRELQ